MNTQISTDSFSDKINEARFWSVGSKKFLSSALLAVSLSSAPAMANELANTDIAQLAQLTSTESIAPAAPKIASFNKSDYSQYSPGEQARDIYSAGYDQIMKNQRSGVYTHPSLPGEIITLRFESDPDAEKRIQADLAVLFGDEAGYKWQRNLGTMIHGFGRPGSVPERSFHVQDPFSIGRDVNYIYLKESKFERGFKVDGYPELDEDGYTKYIGIQTLEHEIAHSLPHQQLSVGQLAITPFNRDDIKGLEVSSVFMSNVMTAQKMKQDGLSLESIDAFLTLNKNGGWRQIGATEVDGPFIVSAETDKIYLLENDVDKNASHPVFIAATAAKDLFDRDPEAFLSLSRSDAERLSMELMNKSKSYNFAPDVIQQIDHNLHHNLQNNLLVEAIVEEFSKANNAYAQGDKNAFDPIIQNLQQNPDNLFHQNLIKELNNRSGEFGTLDKSSLRDIFEKAYTDTKMAPLQKAGGALIGLSTETQRSLGEIGRLDLIQFTSEFHEKHSGPLFEKYKNSQIQSAEAQLDMKIDPSKIELSSAEVTLSPLQQRTLDELFSMKDSAPPGRIAVDIQNVLKESIPDLSDSTWRVIADGIRQGHDLKTIIEDATVPAPQPILPAAAATPANEPEPERSLRNNYAPKPKFG